MLGLFTIALLVDTLGVRVGNIRVIAEPAQQTFAVSLARQAEKPVDWPGLGRRTPPAFTLVLASDSLAMARMTSGQAPGWGAGVTIPDARMIILRADLPDVPQTLRHELAHLVLRSLVTSRLPLWFDEGFAAWGSGEVNRAESLELNLAVAAGRVPSFAQLDGMLRGSSTTADLAYALSASAVSELSRREPRGGLERLLSHLASGVPFDSAMVLSTGLTVDRFEEAWQTALKRRYSLLTWLVAGGMWSVIAFGLGGLAWYKKERDRPRRAALDRGWVIPPPEDLPESVPTLPEVAYPRPEGSPVDPREPRE